MRLPPRVFLVFGIAWWALGWSFDGLTPQQGPGTTLSHTLMGSSVFGPSGAAETRPPASCLHLGM